MSTTPTVTVTLSAEDALGVGHSLRALAATGRPNAATAVTFDRVGSQIVSAAKAQLAAAKGAR